MKNNAITRFGVAAAALLASTTALTATAAAAAPSIPVGPLAKIAPTANPISASFGASKVDGPITRDEVIRRGRYWTDQHLAYSQKRSAPDPDGRRYRMDCSGFISMAWHLGNSLNTRSLKSVAHKISWNDLKPGDMLLKNENPATPGREFPWPSQHVVMFEKWENSAKTSMMILQEGSTKSGAYRRVFDKSYYTKRGFIPYRYNRIVDSEPQRSGQDELLFYNGASGAYAYYDVASNASIGKPIRSSEASRDGYSKAWTSITNVDLDGNGRDELLFFNRSKGEYAYYNVDANGKIGRPIRSSQASGKYGTNWTSVTGVDIDGDGQDELMFYDAASGAYAYYNVNARGELGRPITSSGIAKNRYTRGWSSVTNVDINGDGHDEMLFYNRSNGAFAYYHVDAKGQLSRPIRKSTSTAKYSKGWSSVTNLDINGDGHDELLFYNQSNGAFAYYSVGATGAIGRPLRKSTATAKYSTGWTAVVNVDLDGR